MPQISLTLDDFRELRKKDRLFIDKSRLISEFWKDNAKVILLPRPRRFGKSLNLSMLKYFFALWEKDSANLFSDLAIAQDAQMMAEQGQYPVIHLNLKSIKSENFSAAMELLGSLIARTLVTFSAKWISPSILNASQHNTFTALAEARPSLAQLQESLYFMSAILHELTGRRVIILIDEYDVPLLDFHHAQKAEYQRMVDFYRGFFGAALKDNPHLEKGCLTGVLRIARESIFSDLNNVIVRSMLHQPYSTCFGFTESEVATLLESFGLCHKMETVREWYNGYRFGETIIYNPWSVLNFIKGSAPPEPYWVHTSANLPIRALIVEHGAAIREEVAILIAGETIEAPLNEHIVLSDVGMDRNHIWSFLTFTGYLKPISRRLERRQILYQLQIPNEEVRWFYEYALSQWLSRVFGISPVQPLLKALSAGKWEEFEGYLNQMLRQTVSYHDTASKELFYHALFIGMLLHLPNYRVRSNRESGLGRFDCALIPQDKQATGLVLEFKTVEGKKEAGFSRALHAALQQIQQYHYADELLQLGILKITAVAIAVNGKQARVQAQPISLTPQ